MLKPWYAFFVTKFVGKRTGSGIDRQGLRHGMMPRFKASTIRCVSSARISFCVFIVVSSQGPGFPTNRGTIL